METTIGARGPDFLGGSATTVDPKMQISADEYREIRRRRAEQKSRYEQGETSKAGTTKLQVTSQILLNKW